MYDLSYIDIYIFGSCQAGYGMCTGYHAEAKLRGGGGGIISAERGRRIIIWGVIERHL